MAVTTKAYPLVLKSLLNKELDFDSDNICLMLMTSSYVYSAAHQYKSSITNEVAGTGYTAGGTTLTSPTVTHTVANSWATARAATTAYTQSQIVRPAAGNGFLYECTTPGTTGAGTPTYPTVIGQTVTDGTVVWTCAGEGILIVDAADPTWAALTTTCRYGAFYDKTPATDATRPLISFIDLGGDMSPAGGGFTVTLDNPTGIFYVFV